jgi:hypothetical protein
MLSNDQTILMKMSITALGAAGSDCRAGQQKTADYSN